MASKEDYDFVAEILKEKNKLTVQEFEEGHLGVVMPADQRVRDDIFNNIIDQS